MRRQILLLAALVSTVPTVAASGQPGVAAPYVASRDPAEFEQSLECLTQAVYYEARNQSAEGQRAVAQVVLNRVRHPSYPNSVCGTVFQGSERATGCQFSFTCDGSMYGYIEPDAWDFAQQIAREALSGSVYRPVGLALNYHSTSIRPYWAPGLTRQAVVGSHIFYRQPDSTEASFTQDPGAEVMVASAPCLVRSSSRPCMAGARVRSACATRSRSSRFPSSSARSASGPSAPRQSSASRPAASRPAAARRAAPRVSIESGVRVARGS